MAEQEWTPRTLGTSGSPCSLWFPVCILLFPWTLSATHGATAITHWPWEAAPFTAAPDHLVTFLQDLFPPAPSLLSPSCSQTRASSPPVCCPWTLHPGHTALRVASSSLRPGWLSCPSAFCSVCLYVRCLCQVHTLISSLFMRQELAR